MSSSGQVRSGDVLTAVSPGDLIPEVEEYVYALLHEDLPDNYYFHCYEHTADVVRWATTIGRHSGLEGDDLSLVTIAAQFHDTGFTRGCENHEQSSSRIARAFLESHGLDDEDMDTIHELILSTHLEHASRNLSESVLHDADICHIGKKKKFFSYGNRLRREWEEVNDIVFTDVEWNALQISFLESMSFETHYARQRYEKTRLMNLRTVRERHPRWVQAETEGLRAS